jgi:hypothetical protein
MLSPSHFVAAESCGAGLGINPTLVEWPVLPHATLCRSDFQFELRQPSRQNDIPTTETCGIPANYRH